MDQEAMRPTHDPKELFPMPNSRGVSFKREDNSQNEASRLIGQGRALPSATAKKSGLSLLSIRASK